MATLINFLRHSGNFRTMKLAQENRLIGETAGNRVLDARLRLAERRWFKAASSWRFVTFCNLWLAPDCGEPRGMIDHIDV